MSREQINVFICDICGVIGIPQPNKVEHGKSLPPDGWMAGEPNNRHFCPSCRIAVEKIRENTVSHTQYKGKTIYAGE